LGGEGGEEMSDFLPLPGAPEPPPPPPLPSLTGRMFYRNEQDTLISKSSKLSTVDKNCIFVSRYVRKGCGKRKELCSVPCVGGPIKLSYEYKRGGHCLIIDGTSYSEADIRNNIETSVSLLDKEGSVLRKKLETIFTRHAKGLGNSPLISGCIDSKYVFGAWKSYSSVWQCTIKLIGRIPIKNIWPSGGEGEYFLIGKVMAGECPERTLNFVGPESSRSSSPQKKKPPGPPVPSPPVKTGGAAYRGRPVSLGPKPPFRQKKR
jgi:hypothetical protein